jgi:hypothetical protein
MRAKLPGAVQAGCASARIRSLIRQRARSEPLSARAESSWVRSFSSGIRASLDADPAIGWIRQEMQDIARAIDHLH